MQNAAVLASLVGPLYILMGLSILLHPKSWQQLAERYQKNHYELFPLMIFLVIFGLIMISSYSVWTWDIWLLVTISGWGMFLKGVFYFLAPGEWITPALGMSKRKEFLYVGGVVALALGAALCYPVYMA